MPQDKLKKYIRTRSARKSIWTRLRLFSYFYIIAFGIIIFWGTVVLQNRADELTDKVQSMESVGMLLEGLSNLRLEQDAAFEELKKLYAQPEVDRTGSTLSLIRSRFEDKNILILNLISRAKKEVSELIEPISNYELAPDVQSYFLGLKTNLIQSVIKQENYYKRGSRIFDRFRRYEEQTQTTNKNSPAPSTNFNLPKNHYIEIIKGHAEFKEDTLKNYFRASTREILFQTSIFIAIVVLLSLISTIYIVQRLLRSINLTSQIAKDISQGSREIEIPDDWLKQSNDEAFQLLYQMKKMGESIRNHEKELESQHEYVHALLESSPTPLVILSEYLKVEYMNYAFRRSYDLSQNKFGDDLFTNPSSRWHIPKLVTYLSDLKSSSKTSETEITHDFPTVGKRILQIFSRKLLRYVDGKVRIFYLLTVFDITKEKQDQEQLIRMTKKAKQAANAKSRFLSNMSHEIRTPLNAIVGMADLLKETQLNRQQKKYVETFSKASNTLLDLINDVLDFAKIEEDEISINIEAFNLKECISGLAEIMSIRADEKGLHFSVEIDSQVPENVFGDSMRLRQVLTNLIGNAIKFTNEGEVKLKVTCPKGANGNIHDILFETIDSGIGIDKKSTTQIFEKFQQTDPSITRQYGGSGLGLSISKHLVEKMGGHIKVRSEPGKGSVFYFQLPMKKSSIITKDMKGRDQLAAVEYSFQGEKILFVEDSVDNREILKAFVAPYNLKTSFAKNGAEALKKVKTNHYDIIMMDIEMPTMDGITAFKMIRKFEKDNSKEKTPIFAMTAYALKEEQERFIEIGFDGQLVKPFRKDTVLEFLFTHLSRKDKNAMIPTLVDKDIDTAVKELLPRYIENRKRDIQRIERALSNRQFPIVSGIGHRIKGSSVTYGLKKLRFIGQELETSGKNEDFSSASTSLKKLKSFIEQVDREVNL